MAEQDDMQRAAEARRKGLTEQQATYVAALKAERHGYQTRGDTERVRQVDAEIAKVAGLEANRIEVKIPEHAAKTAAQKMRATGGRVPKGKP